MGFMDRLMGRGPDKAAPTAAPRAAAPSSRAGAPSTTHGANSPQQVRKELVRVTVRETLVHNGIPADWITTEPLTTASPGREAGVHVRLVVRHWDPRLMHHAVALQDNFEKRLQAMDPQTPQWLMGVSWQFSLVDRSACPPLPHPGSWTAPVVTGHGELDTVPPTQPGGSADVISGPTRIGAQQSAADKRKELERLLGERDRQFGGNDNSGFGATQPMGFDKTEPAPFDKTEPAPFDKTQAFRR